MADHAYPTTTPNVVIKDPGRRQKVYDVLGVVGLVLAAAVAADAASPAFDISQITLPAFAVYGVFASGLGFYPARQNVPGVN
jgi:hypothetical protein